MQIRLTAGRFQVLNGIRFLLLFFAQTTSALPASKGSVRGILKESLSGNPAPFVNVSLHKNTDSTFLAATQSDVAGRFELTGIAAGEYILRFTSVSYVPKIVKIDMKNQCLIELDTILLSDTPIALKEVMVRGERDRAQADVSKTIFQINPEMKELASGGMELLKQLPGISIDLAQNISLEGSTKVLILVNGMERDAKYLSQLPAADIDQVEIMTNPPARYGGGAIKVIHVVLKNGRSPGWSGNLNVETPTLKKQIYAFPSGRLSYGRGKFDSFVSYSGSLGYFDILEQSRRQISETGQETSISSYRYERQKNWSHRFSYGLDYIFNKRNSITVYGNFNPYSHELDGNIRAAYEGRVATGWNYLKEDTDKNFGNFYSVFYRKTTGKEREGELTIDCSFYHFRAKSQTIFTEKASGNVEVNSTWPVQNTFSLRADYTMPLSSSFKLATGFQVKSNHFADKNQRAFRYAGTEQSLHGSIRFTRQKFVSEVSFRIERAVSGLTGGGSRTYNAFLPNLVFQFLPEQGVSLKGNYQRVLEYPVLYQLNPLQMLEDPGSYRAGNPGLRPAAVTRAGVEYSRSRGRSFVGFRIFYNNWKDVINDLTRPTESRELLTQPFNAGVIQQIGGQLTGTVSIGKPIRLQGYLKLFRAFAVADREIAFQDLEDRHKTACEITLSANTTLPYDLALVIQFSYNSPTIEIQKIVFADPLYFVSLQKSISKTVRAGITLALPFAKTFTYQGERIRSQSLTSDISKTIHLTTVPVFLKASYTFNKGEKRNQVKENNADAGFRQKKGF